MFPSASDHLKRASSPGAASPQESKKRVRHEATVASPKSPPDPTTTSSSAQTVPVPGSLHCLLHEMCVNAAPIDDFLQGVGSPGSPLSAADPPDGTSEQLGNSNYLQAAQTNNLSPTAVKNVLDGVAGLRTQLRQLGKFLDRFDEFSAEISIKNASGDDAFAEPKRVAVVSENRGSVGGGYYQRAPVRKEHAPITVSSLIEMLPEVLRKALKDTEEISDAAREKALLDRTSKLWEGSVVYEARKNEDRELPSWLFAEVRCSMNGREYRTPDQLPSGESCMPQLAISWLTPTLECSGNSADTMVLGSSPVSVVVPSRGDSVVVEQLKHGVCYLVWKGMPKNDKSPYSASALYKSLSRGKNFDLLIHFEEDGGGAWTRCNMSTNNNRKGRCWDFTGTAGKSEWRYTDVVAEGRGLSNPSEAVREQAMRTYFAGNVVVKQGTIERLTRSMIGSPLLDRLFPKNFNWGDGDGNGVRFGGGRVFTDNLNDEQRLRLRKFLPCLHSLLWSHPELGVLLPSSQSSPLFRKWEARLRFDPAFDRLLQDVLELTHDRSQQASDPSVDFAEHAAAQAAAAFLSNDGRPFFTCSLIGEAAYSLRVHRDQLVNKTRVAKKVAEARQEEKRGLHRVILMSLCLVHV